MKAKPSKCRSLALINFTTKSSHSYGYSDGGLHIGVDPIPDIADTPFKFLGRYISKDLSDKSQQESLLKGFEGYMIMLDSKSLKGIAKAWIYKHFLMSFIS